MKAIVRKAQSDFQFSMIYEQRKTNRLLVEGFTSLAMALEEMTWQITSSIDSLNDSIRGIDVSVRQSLNELNTSSSEMSRSIDVQLSDMAEREQKALQILDNIQHRKLL